jgi:glutamate-1-semialdehyde 2,1-aminomutase
LIPVPFRLGYHGAQGLFDIDPDLTTLGKILGGGFPVGAIAGRKEFMAVFDPRHGKPALPHGGTFSANPVTMRAGLAAMELLDEAAFRRLDLIGDRVRTGINEAFGRTGLPGGTVGLGSLLKVHFADRPIRDYRSAYPTEREVRRQAIFNLGLLNRGVLAAAYGLMALSTPMTDEDIDVIIAAASEALAELASSA